MAESLIIFPYGGNAREAVLAIHAINAVGTRFEVLGYLDDNHARLTGADYPILGGSDAWASYRGRARLLAVPGSPKSFRLRRQLVDGFALGPGDVVTIVDPSVRLAHSACVGRNSLIMAGVFVSTGAVVGNHCVVLPNTVISHDARIGDYSLIGSNVSISGGVEVGENCYIGSGAKLKEGIRVGAGALVGLGAVVVDDVPTGVVVAGVPARPLAGV